VPERAWEFDSPLSHYLTRRFAATSTAPMSSTLVAATLAAGLIENDAKATNGPPHRDRRSPPCDQAACPPDRRGERLPRPACRGRPRTSLEPARGRGVGEALARREALALAHGLHEVGVAGVHGACRITESSAEGTESVSDGASSRKVLAPISSGPTREPCLTGPGGYRGCYPLGTRLQD
jgi:hypothetical protein